MNAAPPSRAVRLLARALEDDPAGRAILGDLQEDFARVLRARGPAAARRWYWREAVMLSLGRRLGRTGTSSPGRPPLIRELLQDTVYALRTLRRNPAFALFTAAVIGLGVGAAASVFSVLKPLVIAPLPFEEPHELVWIANDAEPGDNSLHAVTSRSANLHDFRERARTFEGLTGYDAFFDLVGYTLTGIGEPERLVGVEVAHDFLDVLGVRPLRGRSFSAEEGRPGGPPAVILSHGYWQSRFAGDPGVVGRSLTLNDRPHTVVGVLPPTFDFSSVFTPGIGVDVLLPFRVISDGDPGFHGNELFLVGRLRSGATSEMAQAELDAILAALARENPRRWGLGAEVTPLQAQLAAPFRPALLLLAAAAGTLLLLVCVNISNLILARSPGRTRELAVRKALGASRGRLVRQLVLETLAIALAGAVLGSGLALMTTRLVAGSAGVRIPLLNSVQVDVPVLVFAAAVAVLTGLLVGLVPALQVWEGGEASVLRDGSRTHSHGRGARRLREALVMLQVTLACVLLVAGGLLVKSYRAVAGVDLGFDARDAVAWQLSPAKPFESPRERSDFFAALAARVASVPGVSAVGLIDELPLGQSRTWPFEVVGVPDDGEEATDRIFPHVIDPGYLAAMRIPVIEGRGFSRHDTEETTPVVLLNESGARRLFTGESALGRHVRTFAPWDWEVVGVVNDVRHLSPEMDPGVQVYFPMAQMPDYPRPDMVVRSRLPLTQTIAAVSAALREVDPTMPTGEFWTLESTVDRAVSARRFTLLVLAAFGAAALLLAALGIYGVVAHSVAERTAEIGIRMALGASAAGVFGSVLGRTLLLAGLGVAAGVVLSLLGTRLLMSLLYGVSATDPSTFVAIALGLLTVAAAAGAVPAARAAHTRAWVALRGD
jgi:putative ABC transport system permease protein